MNVEPWANLDSRRGLAGALAKCMREALDQTTDYYEPKSSRGGPSFGPPGLLGSNASTAAQDWSSSISPSSRSERCLLPSQVAVHRAKSAELQILAGRYMARFSAGRAEVEHCLRRGGEAAPPKVNPARPKTSRDFLRLVHQQGYALTAHASRHHTTPGLQSDGSEFVDPATGRFRRFTMAD